MALAALAWCVSGPLAAQGAVTPNVCRYSYDGIWRNLDVELAGTLPSPITAGSQAALTAASVRAVLPEALVSAGYNVGILRAGRNDIPARVWLAVAGTGTTPATQVLDLSVAASTTITTNAGGEYVSSTPLDVTLPLPDTVWTAASDTVAIRQAEAGTLPAGLPAGPGGGALTPTGSALISAQLGALRFNLDCQPGRAAAGGTGPVAAAAAPFASSAPAAPPPPPPVYGSRPPFPIVALRPQPLRASDGRLSIVLGNLGTAEARGTLVLRTAFGVRLGRGPARLLPVARTIAYRVAPGATITLRPLLTAQARALLRTRPRITVRALVRDQRGVTVRDRRLDLRRPAPR